MFYPDRTHWLALRQYLILEGLQRSLWNSQVLGGRKGIYFVMGFDLSKVVRTYMVETFLVIRVAFFSETALL